MPSQYHTILALLPDHARADLPRQVQTALAEDVGDGDLTAQLIDADTTASATIISREAAVICGQAWVEEVFFQLGGAVTIEWLVKDGDQMQPDTLLCKLHGNTRQILTGERTALNFLQTLSGTATAAKVFADAAAGKNIQVLDTRKTIPGLRSAQKYAVTCGGCGNHRLALYDAFLIKENHIAAAGSITAAVRKARQLAPGKRVIVEVENTEELAEAIAAKPDQIMLDEFSPADIPQAKSAHDAGITVEISGSVTPESLQAMPTLDFPVVVSSGSITKHVRAVDLSLRITPTQGIRP